MFAARYVPDCAATEATTANPAFLPAIRRDDCSERTVMSVPADVPPPKALARGDTQHRSHEVSRWVRNEGETEQRSRLPEHALKALSHDFKEAHDASFKISCSPFVPRGLS